MFKQEQKNTLANMFYTKYFTYICISTIFFSFSIFRLKTMDSDLSSSLATKSQLCRIYRDLQNKLQNSNAPSSTTERNREIMNLLHEFNEVKDATQIVIGALSNLECKTIKEMHLLYNLPLNE